jgi:hypothetical protein
VEDNALDLLEQVIFFYFVWLYIFFKRGFLWEEKSDSW